jgi:hypothetical protein
LWTGIFQRRSVAFVSGDRALEGELGNAAVDLTVDPIREELS